jgi:hypothetical protein
MTVVNFFTYRDAVRHMVDYLGADVEGSAKRDARRSILAGYREFSTAARWCYYYQRGRINTVAPQSTGTVEYTNSTRQLTLTGATWPSWVTFGTVAINNVSYDVDTSVSSTVVTLSVNSNPGADVAALTTYTLYRDTYPMPADFTAADEFADVANYSKPIYVHPATWLSQQRLSKSPATPRTYTFTSDPHYFGTMAVRFYPPPDTIHAYDFIYQRRPRPLVYDDVNAGTITVTASSSSVAGTGTAFDSKYVGSVIRNSLTATDLPEGLEWETPYDVERVILSVTNATTLAVDTAYVNARSGVLYTISDPVDVEAGAMLNAFLRCCEKNAAYSRRMAKGIQEAEKNYHMALILAREADNRHFERHDASDSSVAPIRLALMPRGPDVS